MRLPILMPQTSSRSATPTRECWRTDIVARGKVFLLIVRNAAQALQELRAAVGQPLEILIDLFKLAEQTVDSHKESPTKQP